MVAICVLPPSRVAAPHDRNPPLAMFRRRIDQRSTPAQVGSWPFLRNAGRHMSCPILLFAPPRPKAACLAALHRDREQPPLPTLAGFEFVAEDVASHDGSLSTLRRTIVDPRRKRSRRVSLHRGSLVVRQRLGPEVVARDRDRVSSLCLCAQRQTAGVSDNLTLRGRRDPWRDACPSSDCTLAVCVDVVDTLAATGALSSRRQSRVPGQLRCLIFVFRRPRRRTLWRPRRWVRLCGCWCGVLSVRRNASSGMRLGRIRPFGDDAAST